MRNWEKVAIKLKDPAEQPYELTPQEIAYLKRMENIKSLAEKGAAPIYQGMQEHSDQTTSAQEKLLKQKQLTPEEIYLQNIDDYSKSLKQNLIKGK